MRALPVALVLALAACQTGTGYAPIEAGVFGVPTSGGASGAGSSGGTGTGGATGGGSSGGSSGAATVGCGVDGAACDGGGLCCAGACIDPTVDPANCGGCATVCASGDFCDLGSCQPVPQCGLGTLGADCPLGDGGVGGCCGAGCTPIADDPLDCGGCGLVCPVGSSCAGGSCVVPGGGPASCQGDAGACPAGFACAGNACIASACGDGGSGAVCLFGPGTSGAPLLGVCCSTTCTDVTQDPANCGGCGLACVSGVCDPAAAECLPPPGIDGGSCGSTCGAGQACAGNVCVDQSGCQGPADLCFVSGSGNVGACCPSGSGAFGCADLASDPANCGDCGVACPAGQGCIGGVCQGSQGSCGAGTKGKFCNLDAGATWLCCPGRGCTNLLGDDLNCGGCGIGCDAGTTCIDGRCLATACGPATQNDRCLLVDGGAGLCCSSACLDVSADPANCGACQTSCTGTESCRGAACAYDACAPDLFNAPCHLDGGLGSCCGAACADTQSDPGNCGACGVACGDAGCVAGVCS